MIKKTTYLLSLCELEFMNSESFQYDREGHVSFNTSKYSPKMQTRSTNTRVCESSIGRTMYNYNLLHVTKTTIRSCNANLLLK